MFKKLILAAILSVLSLPAMAAFSLPNYTLAATGQSVPYWVISSITLNPVNSTIQVSVGGYISSAAYVGGLQPVTRQGFTISGATYQSFLASLTTADLPVGTAQGSLVAELVGVLQTNMLTLPFFNGATIVQ